MTEHFLDLRGVACPMNFVKARLFVDKIATGEVVKLCLDEGEPVESVGSSMKAEGHEVFDVAKEGPGRYCMYIRKG
jgi:sulfite reductase (ferredoxin)